MLATALCGSTARALKLWVRRSISRATRARLRAMRVAAVSAAIAFDSNTAVNVSDLLVLSWAPRTLARVVMAATGFPRLCCGAAAHS